MPLDLLKVSIPRASVQFNQNLSNPARIISGIIGGDQLLRVENIKNISERLVLVGKTRICNYPGRTARFKNPNYPNLVSVVTPYDYRAF